MSFGTGHHETTHMMIQHLLDLDLENKKTLDMGCGTGILAIFAEMKGAKPIDGIDIDNWCYVNLNRKCPTQSIVRIRFHVYEGDASLLSTQSNMMLSLQTSIEIFLLADMKIYVHDLFY